MRRLRLMLFTPLLLPLLLLTSPPPLAGQSTTRTVTYPASVTLGPGQSVRFVPPDLTPSPNAPTVPPGAPPLPPIFQHVPRPEVTNSSDTSATVAYVAPPSGTRQLTITVGPGLAVDLIETRMRNLQCAPADRTLRTLNCLPVGSLTASHVAVFDVTDTALAGRRLHFLQGRHLIGGPTGTVIAAADGPLLAYDPQTNDYRAVPQGEPLEAGRGYWVRFRTERPTDDVLVELAATSDEELDVPLPAGKYALIGNPFLRNARVEGGDFLYRFTDRYAMTDLRRSPGELRPGEGAWVYSQAGGTLRLRETPLP